MSDAPLVSAAMRAYYDDRAAEYDDWWLGAGLFASRERPGWREAVAELVAFVAALPPARVLDVACGTAFLTRHLRGEVTALDQSPRMVALARERLPGGRVVCGDAVPLPFADGEFERVVSGHFYGHLLPGERERFLAEARRVAPAVVLIDSARRDDTGAEQWQARTLGDGSSHRVYKRYFESAGLADEIGGEVLLANRWFIAAGG
jgi:ubiquinone/menaquinone biosynthesis C-methylase UbiE